MVCLGLWKNLDSGEILQTDRQQIPDRQSEHTHARICSLSLTYMHACTHTHTVFCRKKSEITYFAENWYPVVFVQILKESLYLYRFWRNCCICTDPGGTLMCLYSSKGTVVFVQILKEPCCVCTDPEGECTCMSDPCPLHRPAGEQRWVLPSTSSFSSSAHLCVWCF